MSLNLVPLSPVNTKWCSSDSLTSVCLEDAVTNGRPFHTSGFASTLTDTDT